MRGRRCARGDAPARSPEHALVDLKNGNARFMSQPQLCELDLIKQRAGVAGGSGAVGDDPQLRR